MAKLDNDTIALYKLIAKHGSDWVKKRLCPKEAAQYAVERHYNVMTPGTLPEGWRPEPAQEAFLSQETAKPGAILAINDERRVAWLEGSWDLDTTLTEDDGEPQ
jgi:hypothetical protein